ncbi:hypothetical protein [Nonomuraea sp. NPDC050691]|uniref:hypothetical protein n=1 Tax=Nonomuraea sp. NPDC050691 TaxID=3155661 RepID=UPI0033EF0665
MTPATHGHRTAIVTGAARGIGAAVARRPARADEAAVTDAVTRVPAEPPAVPVDNAGMGPRAGLGEPATQQGDTVAGGPVD